MSIGSDESTTVMKMFINGPIADIQRQFKRQTEARWYDPIAELLEGVEQKGKTKHIWNVNKIAEEHVGKPTPSMEPPKVLSAEEKEIKGLRKEAYVEMVRMVKEL